MATHILVTGKYFTGQGLRAFEPVIEELILSAEKEIYVAAYVMTVSVLPMLALLETVLERGIEVLFVLNNFEQYPKRVKCRLMDLTKRFSYMRLVDFSDVDGSQLHAKVLVVDRERAVIGSANFSWGGMVGNHEIGVYLEGDHARKVAKLIDNLVVKIQPKI